MYPARVAKQSSRMLFNCVTIIGPGLMGGSLGMALRHRKLAREVLGVARRAETLEAAATVGAVDRATVDLRAAVAGADLIVVATPVSAIVPSLRRAAPYIPAGCLVTDMGSVKAPVVAEAEECVPPCASFVGGHPMCGSEESGPRAARPDLYEGAVWAITPSANTASHAVDRLAELAMAVGAKPLVLPPELHDSAVASASHLPHVAAAALALAVAAASAGNPFVERLCSTGYRDTTRVAAGPAEMWRDILLANRDALLAALGRYSEWFEHLREAVEAGDGESITALLAHAAQARRACLGGKE